MTLEETSEVMWSMTLLKQGYIEPVAQDCLDGLEVNFSLILFFKFSSLTKLFQFMLLISKIC